MDRKSIKKRVKELIDKLSTDKAKVILELLERFNEKEEKQVTGGEGEHAPPEPWRYKINLIRKI